MKILKKKKKNIYIFFFFFFFFLRLGIFISNWEKSHLNPIGEGAEFRLLRTQKKFLSTHRRAKKAADHNAARNRQDSMTNTNHKKDPYMLSCLNSTCKIRHVSSIYNTFCICSRTPEGPTLMSGKQRAPINQS